MLDKIGVFISKHPWLVVGIILLITLGFGSFLPGLEMQTTMDHFLPEDETVIANEKINDYFGYDVEMMMVYVENDKASSVVSPDALKEMYDISNRINDDFEEIIGVMSISGFVDNICGMEFQKSLNNCSSEQIKTAFDNLMSDPDYSVLKMLAEDDANEPVDYKRLPRLSKGENLDSIDLKNYFIQQTEDQFIFTFEVYDLSNLEEELTNPLNGLTVYEWFLEFKNLIIPDEQMNMTYKISAHVEPTSTYWEIGNGFFNNIKGIFGREKNSYQKNAILWISMPGQPVSLPINLETGNVTFAPEENKITITVSKEELGMYGLAPEMNGFGMPGQIGNSASGFRYFQRPITHLPWKGITLDFEYLKERLAKLQSRPILGGISEKILARNNFTWQNLDEMFAMLEQNNFIIEDISLKDIENLWTTGDIAPDDGKSDVSLFVKPSFFDGMKESVLTFLSYDEKYSDAKAALMMIQIDGSLSAEELSELSGEIVEKLNEYDSEKNYISTRATGNSVIEYEINDVMMDANQIVIPLIFVVISIILFLSFFKVSYVILPLLGLSISVIWLFGTMVLLGMQFMIMEVALIPMLMGLGVDYSVHMFHDYRAELGKGKKPAQAIISSITDVGMAMFLATITTFIAFLSFLTATMIPMRDFGLLCAIGIAYIFIVTITLQAAIRYILDRRKNPEKVKTKHDPNGKVMKKTARIVCKHPKTILIITLLVTLVMVFGATQVRTGFNMEDFLPEENESVQVLNKIMEEFPFSSQEKENILIEGNIATVGTLKGIYDTIKNMDDNKYVLYTTNNEPKTNSVMSLINTAVAQNSSLIERFDLDSKNIPNTDSQVKELFDYLYDRYSYETIELIHRNDKEIYDATVVVVYTNIMNGDDEDLNTVMGDLYNEIKEDVVDLDGNSAVITGDNSMMFSIMNSMTESQIISTFICILLAGIVLIIAYRKLSLGLISMIPVCISTIWIVGTMYFIGYSLNVMTIMITSMTIGLGITYAIHAIERFRIVADRTGDVIEAISETIGHTGGALMIAAITTIAGFGMLMLTPMPVEQQFGLITALTILFAFLTSIFILPPVLMLWGRWKKKKYGFIISPNKPKK